MWRIDAHRSATAPARHVAIAPLAELLRHSVACHPKLATMPIPSVRKLTGVPYGNNDLPTCHTLAGIHEHQVLGHMCAWPEEEHGARTPFCPSSLDARRSMRITPVEEGDTAQLSRLSSERIVSAPSRRAGAEVAENASARCCAASCIAAGPGMAVAEADGFRSTYESKGDTGSLAPSMPCAPSHGTQGLWLCKGRDGILGLRQKTSPQDRCKWVCAYKAPWCVPEDDDAGFGWSLTAAWVSIVSA